MKTILELSRTKALDYFMQSSNYSTLPLPIYFDFQKILNFVKTNIGTKDFATCLESKKNPSDYDGVNYNLFINKDGRYAYRPLQLTNPFLYYFLVREITRTKHWNLLKTRFKEFENPNLEVVSIPLVKGASDKSITATTIKSWWEHIEQRSIELSLEYKYIFITDITNCYGSIYTHSISWALFGMDYAKEHRKEKNLGKLIDEYIMGMQYGQTNGIPQGSALFDFIAEIVLGYADLLLYEKLQNEGIKSYKILRYRDDYRIFCNSKEDIEKIAMNLQSVLSVLNFQLNSSKTKLSENVLEESIKDDKLYYILNTPINKGKETVFSTFQHELLYILLFSRKHPNSGTLLKLLGKFNERLFMTKKNIEDINILSAIVVEIAMNNPNTYRPVISIISNLLTRIKDTKDQENLAKIISTKFSQLPNIGYLQLWMQRFTYEMTIPMDYTEQLCKIVEKEEDVTIWNNDWLKQEYREDFPLYDICSNWITDSFTPIISIDEVSEFSY